jgi:hypothetical protein
MIVIQQKDRPPSASPVQLDEHLRFAITRKRLLQLKYNGRMRIAEPHDYGVKNGTRKLLVYQLGAATATRPGRKPERGWKLLEASKIQECSVLDPTLAAVVASHRSVTSSGTNFLSG